MLTDAPASDALNGICPYFTMFPLHFPRSLLARHAESSNWVLDPFCGRGTTNFASRLLGLGSVGIDSNPVAAAIAQAKLVSPSPAAIIQSASLLLEQASQPRELPEGEFWELAYHPVVLRTLCRLREGLLKECRTPAQVALRALILGALHGPRPKSRPSYFSNQSQRTYAPKPRYAVKFWRQRNLLPEPVDVLGIIEDRAHRYFREDAPGAVGEILQADSRDPSVFAPIVRQHRFDWIITSPPYYGMRTYRPDQWLRSWFLGGPAQVDYGQAGQVAHSSAEIFAQQLRAVWQNVGGVCNPGAHLVIRFGGINDRRVDPLGLLVASLDGTGWRITRHDPAGSASAGRRQSLHFSHSPTRALDEHDVWAVWQL